MVIPFKRCSPFYWSEHMDGFSVDLAIFLAATFAGALVAGLSGFAFGLIAASLWLYILTPLQTATLIIVFGLIVQGYFRLETSPCARLDQALAVSDRSGDWCPGRRDHFDMGKSCSRASWRRDLSRPL
jgi:hypothetical protein